MPSIALNLNDMSVVRNYSGALENVSARAEQAGSALFDVGSILWGAGSTISNMFQYLLSADGLQSVGKVVTYPVTYPLNLAGKAMGGGFQLFEEGIDKGVILSLDGKEKVSNGVEKALNGAGKALENGTGKGIEVFAGAADKTISCAEGIFSFVKGNPFASPEMVETTTSSLRNGL